MKKGIIYEWRNKLNGKFYVGQTVNPKSRYNNHLKAQGDSAFHCAIRKHGIENFEYSVVATYEHETSEGLYDLLNEAEKERIKFRNSLAPNGYNVAEGGNSGYKLVGYSDEERKQVYKKVSKKMKQHYIDNPDARVIRSKGIKQHYIDNPDARKQRSIAEKKRFEGENGKLERKKISEKLSGENGPMYGKNVEDFMTPEAIKQKRKKQSEKLSGENNPMYGKDVKDFMTPEEIEQWKSNISKAFKGKIPVNNGIKCIKIPKETLDEYLATHPGWVRGMLKSTKISCLRWVNKDGKRKRVPVDEVENYIADGWSLGKKSKNAA